MKITDEMDLKEINIEDKEKNVNTFLVLAEKLKIKNNEEYNGAAEKLKEIKAKNKELETERKGLTDPLEKTKKRIIALFKRPQDVLSRAEGIIKGALIDFQDEQEKIRLDEERKAQEKSRKEEEKRISRLSAQMNNAMEKGNDIKADRIQQQMEDNSLQPLPVVESKTEKVEGISSRKLCRYRIKDISLIPREWMMANDAMLKKYAEATKGKIPIPGIEFYEEKIISARS